MEENQPPRTLVVKKHCQVKYHLKQLDNTGGADYARQSAGAEDSRRAVEFIIKPAINDHFLLVTLLEERFFIIIRLFFFVVVRKNSACV